jgi:hypothetical protein
MVQAERLATLVEVHGHHYPDFNAEVRKSSVKVFRRSFLTVTTWF